ncbi:MAG: methylenetetrahydrofolate reductase, partial [Rhodospirillales bacterium]|nr:methylenetetrahydrofolate reductase [Rhodospirillales bacterium]
MNDPLHSLPVESSLVRRLLGGEFALTAEVTPSVSASPTELLEKSAPLKGLVDAVNVTDGAGARVHMSSMAAATILNANDIEPVVQLTCRDRNRIALIGDLLGIGALGMHNLLILKGDDPTAGDQPQAKPVFDLQSAELLAIAHEMTAQGFIPSKTAKLTNEGVEPNTKAISTPPKFFIGAADMPTAEIDEKWLAGLRKKQACGTRFIQTQLNYDMNIVRQYGQILVDEGFAEHMFFLIGNGPLPSARSAIWMRDNLWGVVVPDDIIRRLDQAEDPKAEGIEICAQQLQEMAEMPGVAGVHLMAPINVPAI